MITKIQLKEILLQYFSLDEINKFLNKRISTLCKNADMDNISKILEILNHYHLLDLIMRCPTILVKGKKQEIEDIINLLKKKELLELLRTCPSILARGKKKKIEDIIHLLEENMVDIKMILSFPSLLLNYKKVVSILKLEREKITDSKFYANVILYLKLTNQYNKIYNRQQLLDLTSSLKIDDDEFLEHIVCHHSKEHTKIIYQTIEQQGYIWVGDYIPCTSEQMNQYSEFILKIVEHTAKYTYNKYKNLSLDYSDLYDFILDILVNRCGSLLINFGLTDAIYGTLFRYLIKYCKLFINSQKTEIDFQKIERTVKSEKKEVSYENNFIQNYFMLTTEEQYFLERMSQYIEEGYSYLELLKEEFCLTEEEVKEKMMTIRDKISNSNYLSDIGKEKYLKK